VVHTLQSKFSDMVKPYLRDGVLPESNYKKTLKSIHMNIVAANKKSLVNKILGVPPPEIHSSEASLLRRTRTMLSKLRSSYCNDLKSYQARMGSIDSLHPSELMKPGKPTNQPTWQSRKRGWSSGTTFALNSFSHKVGKFDSR
jgi:hypothetical protein